MAELEEQASKSTQLKGRFAQVSPRFTGGVLGLLFGWFLGIFASYWFQEATVRAAYSLAGYLSELSDRVFNSRPADGVGILLSVHDAALGILVLGVIFSVLGVCAGHVMDRMNVIASPQGQTKQLSGNVPIIILIVGEVIFSAIVLHIFFAPAPPVISPYDFMK